MAVEKLFIIYKHTSPSNKVYIGITQQKIHKRFQNGMGYKHNKYFSKAIQKYGWNNFKHEILFDNLSKEEVFKKEIELIAYYKSNNREFGYNLSSGGEFNVPSEDGIKNLIKINTGKRLSKETKSKISQTQKGRIISNETKIKMSLSHKGLIRSESHKINNAIAKYKKVRCIETNEIFDSMKEAQIKYKTNHIHDVCKGKRNLAGGYRWEYV